MTLVVSASADSQLLQRWRRQIAHHSRRRTTRGPRPLVAVGYLIRGSVYDGLVDVRRLLFIVLHDQLHDRRSLELRVAGYTATGVPWGVRIGGPDRCVFEKDLMRAPGRNVRGRRVDLADSELLKLALDLDRYLDRHSVHPRLPRRRQPRWPSLWAAFEPGVAATIDLAGPEWEAACRSNGSPAESAATCRRNVFDLVAYPLEYVSHAWRQFTTVFADLTTTPSRQVLNFDRHCHNLVGFSGTIEFDCAHSRFSTSEATTARKGS